MTNRAPLIAAIVLLVLPVPYVGIYLALVVPGGCLNINGSLNMSATIHPPTYRVGGAWAKAAFWPLEQLDQKLRPKAWEPEKPW